MNLGQRGTILSIWAHIRHNQVITVALERTIQTLIQCFSMVTFTKSFLFQLLSLRAIQSINPLQPFHGGTSCGLQG